MAISDIPEYVEALAGDLIRADNWNAAQRQMRHSLRTHRHTRVSGAPLNDAATTDVAEQINTNEIADGAVTAAKLAAGAVSGNSLPDGAITTAKLADDAVTAAKVAAGAVATAKLANNAVTASKLNFATVNSNSLSLGPSTTAEVLVQAAAPSTKTTVYFPLVAIVASSGTGVSNIDASIVYRQAVNANTNDVFIRLRNTGAATALVAWQVMTFAQ
jgi:hypothetical protein